MNSRQAAALKRLLEAGHPDAVTDATATLGGALVTISGTKKAPGEAGPGGQGDVTLSLGDNSPLLRFMLARHELELKQGRQRPDFRAPD